MELTPLFLAIGVALASGTFFTYKHFAYDNLRLKENPDHSGLKEILAQNDGNNAKN